MYYAYVHASRNLRLARHAFSLLCQTNYAFSEIVTYLIITHNLTKGTIFTHVKFFLGVYDQAVTHFYVFFVGRTI